MSFSAVAPGSAPELDTVVRLAGMEGYQTPAIAEPVSPSSTGSPL